MRIFKSIFAFVYRTLVWIPSAVVPPFVKERSDPERYSVDHFAQHVIAKQVKDGERVLDAGAGTGRYREAARRFEEALGINPQHPRAAANLSAARERY